MKYFQRSEKGFTLIELMMAVSITLLLTSLFVFNVLGQLPGYRLRSTANKVAATLQYLKIRAVTTNLVAWMEVNYDTSGSHYFTGFVDLPDETGPSAAEYSETNLDFPDMVGTVPCFLLPKTVSFGFPDDFTSGTGPDETDFPDAGEYFTAQDVTGPNEWGFIGYRPTGVPVINPANPTALPTAQVIYLTNSEGEGYAVSVQITGRVRVWRWSQSGGGWI